MRNSSVLIATAVWLASCSSVTDAQQINRAGEARTASTYGAEDDPGLAASGRQIVVQECASCHAIDQESMSPRPEAPPMKTLLARYDPDMLANDLIEGVRVGHDDMPRFDFNIIAADAVVAYLREIEAEAKRARGDHRHR